MSDQHFACQVPTLLHCYGMGSHSVFLPIWRAWYTIVSYLYGTGTRYPITYHLALYLHCPGDLTCNQQCSLFTSFSTSY